MNDQFYEGLDVYYQEHFGIIRFVCSDYVTVCIKSGKERLNDICIIVFLHTFDFVF